MATTYPVGYGTQEMTLEQMSARYCEGTMLPEYRRRLLAFLEYKGGVLGIGSAWRRNPHNVSAASRAGHSFHQDQRFGDGQFGFAAVDLVVRRSGGLGHTSGGVPWHLVPVQGSAEAKAWGLHINVKGESWHIQPTEIDGWWSWASAGRKWPVPGRPLPSDIVPPPAMVFDPKNGKFGLWPLNESKPRIAARSFAEARRTRGDTRWQYKGDAVLYLQGVIAHHMGGNIDIDGWFGPQTKGRVMDEQAHAGIAIDGFVGPDTWRMFDSAAV